MAINKNCKQCEKEFEITDDDLAFYKKISPTFDGKTFEIPAPSLCPDCRKQRRLVWRNMSKLYTRKCDLTGKQIFSCMPPNSKFKVYHLNEWMSDKYDPYQYGRDFDFSKSFFSQLQDLNLDVPKMSTNNARNENCEFINNSSKCKNCYLIQNSTAAEESFYSLGLFYSRDCMDCYKVFNSEKCYESINLDKCYECFFCNDLANCSDCLLVDNSYGCKNCFACSNLSNKQYWIDNKQSTKDEFEKIKTEFLSAENHKREEIISRAKTQSSQNAKKYSHINSSENVSGDYIQHSKNCENCFSLDNSESCKYSSNLGFAKNFFDVDYWGDNADICYDSCEVGTDTYNILFSRKIFANTSNAFYCIDFMNGSHDCFGCIGMKHGEYSVFNKKYSKDEYEKLVCKIIEHMQKTGEWGEYFPMSMSEFAYNETSAMDYFPISKEGAVKLGAYWQDENFDNKFTGDAFYPEDISAYYDPSKAEQLLSSILVCDNSLRPYKIQPQELAYYLKNRLQIPKYHPDERYKKRFAQVNPQKTWHRTCMNEGCDVEFETTYAPDRPEKVYCEKCYQKTIM